MELQMISIRFRIQLYLLSSQFWRDQLNAPWGQEGCVPQSQISWIDKFTPFPKVMISKSSWQISIYKLTLRLSAGLAHRRGWPLRWWKPGAASCEFCLKMFFSRYIFLRNWIQPEHLPCFVVSKAGVSTVHDYHKLYPEQEHCLNKESVSKDTLKIAHLKHYIIIWSHLVFVT